MPRPNKCLFSRMFKNGLPASIKELAYHSSYCMYCDWIAHEYDTPYVCQYYHRGTIGVK